jgi:hypothetical protein
LVVPTGESGTGVCSARVKAGDAVNELAVKERQRVEKNNS